MAGKNEASGNSDEKAGVAIRCDSDQRAERDSESIERRLEQTSMISIALMHYLVKTRDGRSGFTSVTNLDVHDVARLTRTFELGQFFVVTPVESQKKHVNEILNHWLEGYGSVYNDFRRQAMQTVKVSDTLENACSALKQRWGKDPIVVGTAAKNISNKVIDYSDLYDKMLSAARPVLIVFGTGWGLHEEAVKRCDFFLEPIKGPGEYNHLSVRSAVTITIDRLIRLI